MQHPRPPAVDETIELLLRGAAAVLGCNSANLVLIDESAARVFVRVGTMREGYTLWSRVERLLGDTPTGLTIPIERARRAPAYRAFQRRELLETASVAGIAGEVFPRAILHAVDRLIGPRRFLCVPTMSATRSFGLLVFERTDPSPFGAGQRELLMRYAARIADLLENELLQRQEGARGRERGAFLGRLLRLVSEDMAPAILVDRDRSVVAANSAAAWLIGISTAELVGRPLRSLFGADEPVDQVIDGQLLPHGEAPPSPPVELLRPDEERLPVTLSPLLLVDADGASVGLVVQLRPAGPEPEQRLAARHGGDWQAVLRRERLATLGELAAQLAHEVRNPLVAVGAALEGLAADHADDRALSDELSLLNRELLRVDLILRDYLTMAGRHRITPERLELAEFMAESAHVARAHRRANGRTLRVECPGDLTLRADRDGLRQVLLNLWLNAFEASRDGGCVECRTESADGRVVISVADRGAGLPGEGDPFAAFFTTKPNGTGLGLTVCQRIVAAHDGTLTLHPREGGGTVARLDLPRRPGGDRREPAGTGR